MASGRLSYDGGTNWVTTTTTTGMYTYNYPQYTSPHYPYYDSYKVTEPPQRTPLQWLDDQIEATCRIARQ